MPRQKKQKEPVKVDMVGHLEYPDTETIRALLFTTTRKPMYSVSRGEKEAWCGTLNNSAVKALLVVGYNVNEVDSGIYYVTKRDVAGLPISAKIDQANNIVIVTVKGSGLDDFHGRLFAVKAYIDNVAKCDGTYDYYTKVALCLEK